MLKRSHFSLPRRVRLNRFWGWKVSLAPYPESLWKARTSGITSRNLPPAMFSLRCNAVPNSCNGRHRVNWIWGSWSQFRGMKKKKNELCLKFMPNLREVFCSKKFRLPFNRIIYPEKWRPRITTEGSCLYSSWSREAAALFE